MKLFVKDLFNFINKLTLRKVYNISKVVGSFYISKWLKRPYPAGNPFTISFEPTTACNLRCPECPSGLRSFTRDTGNLKTDFFKETLEQVYKDLVYLIFYFQGEPYINPGFLEMVRYASERRIYTITSTNGHFLNDSNARKTIESGLDRLIISVDGTTQETYEQYRKGGNLENVLQGAKNVVKWKRELKSATPHIIFQFLVVRPNEHQIEEVYKLAEEIGVNEVKLKTAQVYTYENGNDLIPKNLKYSRYIPLGDGSWKVRHSLVNHCWKLWHSCVITFDGKVVPCCFDKDASHVLGDLKKELFKEIWSGESYTDFRRRIFKGRSEIEICKNCTEGCKVWA